MPGRRTSTAACSIVALLLALWPGEAQAYLDAGTGSMLLQMFVAAAAGCHYLLKLRWRQLKARLVRQPTGTAASAVGPEPTGDELDVD